MSPVTSTNHPDVVLVGAGIMSATLAVFLKELDPSLEIEIHEVLCKRLGNTPFRRRGCVVKWLDE